MIASADRHAALARGLRLEYLSLGYNAVEALVGIAAGLAAGSVALVGFGLDSVAEGASAGVLVWRLRSENSGRRTPEEVERRAVRLVGIAFLVLGFYVAMGAVVELTRGSRPEPSAAGTAIAALSLVVMPLLARGKRSVARDLRSRSLEADSHQTILCTYLSGILLFGLLANGLLGWWWADPVAALGIALLAGSEGVDLLRGGPDHAH